MGAFYDVLKWHNAVQHMLSTDPSYDGKTIASTLKMQIWIAANNRDKVSGYGYGLWCSLK